MLKSITSVTWKKEEENSDDEEIDKKLTWEVNATNENNENVIEIEELPTYLF